MAKIVVLLIGDIIYDGRVKKEIRTLSNLGHDITLIFSESQLPLYEIDIEAKCVLVKKKRGGNLGLIVLRNICFYFKVWKQLMKIRPDYVHCNDLNTLFVSLLKLEGVNYVYDAHEMRFGGRHFLKELFLMYIERFLCQKVKAIIVPQIDRLNILCMKYQLERSKLFLLENYPLEVKIDQKDFFKCEYGFDRGNNIIMSYTGIINDERCIEELILAMVHVDNSVLFLIGKVKDSYLQKLKKIIYCNHLETKVFIRPPVIHDKVLWIAASSDIGICLYRPIRMNSYFSASNKLYELLNCGTKVLSNLTPSTYAVCNEYNSFLIKNISVEEISVATNRLQKLAQPEPTAYFWDTQEQILDNIYK